MASVEIGEAQLQEAFGVLGVSPDATEEEIRAAYLAKIRISPPDRDPEKFEQIRDAYARLRNPKIRARLVLAGPDPTISFADILTDLPPANRRFVGLEPWLAVLKEKR